MALLGFGAMTVWTRAVNWYLAATATKNKTWPRRKNRVIYRSDSDIPIDICLLFRPSDTATFIDERTAVPVTESTIIITTWVACVHGGGQPAGPVSHAVISHLTTQRRVVIASSTTDIKLHTLNSWREMDRWKRICASGIADARRSCVSLSLSLSRCLCVCLLYSDQNPRNASCTDAEVAADQMHRPN